MIGRLLWLVLCLAMAGCGNDPTSPDTTTTTSSVVSSVVFEGTLATHGSSFYSFTNVEAGQVMVTLASLSLVGHHDALSTPVRVGVGVPSGTGCAVADSIETGPALLTQLSSTQAAGIHCVDVADIGQLPSAASFVVRFTHP